MNENRICFPFDSFVTSARESVAEQVEKLRRNLAAAGEQLTRSQFGNVLEQVYEAVEQVSGQLGGGEPGQVARAAAGYDQVSEFVHQCW